MPPTQLTDAEAYQSLKGRISGGDWRYEHFMPEDQVWHWPVEWWNDEDGVPAFLRRPGPLREPCEACDQRSSALMQHTSRLRSGVADATHLLGTGLLFGIGLREANRRCENCDGRSSREPPLGLIVSALHAIADRAEAGGIGRVYVLGYARERRHPDTQEEDQRLRWLTRDQWRAFNAAVPEAARTTQPGAAPDPAPVLAILDSGITTQQFALRLWRAGVSARLTPERQRQLEEALARVPVRKQDAQDAVATRSRRVFVGSEPANLTCLSNVDCDCVSYIAGIANRVVCSTCPDCRGSGLVPLIEFAEHEPCDDSRCDYQTADVRPIRGGIGWIIGDEHRDGVAGGHLISSEYRERAEQQCDAEGVPACARPTPDQAGRLGLQKLPDGSWVCYGAIEWQTTSQAHSARVPLGRLVLDARRRRIERAREKLKQSPRGSLARLLRRWQAQPEALDRPTPAAPDWPKRDVCWRI